MELLRGDGTRVDHVVRCKRCNDGFVDSVNGLITRGEEK